MRFVNTFFISHPYHLQKDSMTTIHLSNPSSHLPKSPYASQWFLTSCNQISLSLEKNALAKRFWVLSLSLL
jgi:hypothetical protein